MVARTSATTGCSHQNQAVRRTTPHSPLRSPGAASWPAPRSGAPARRAGRGGCVPITWESGIMVEMEPLYLCRKCQRDLPRTAFGNDRQKTDGRRRSCLGCDAAIRKARWTAKLNEEHERAKRYRLENAEKVAERKRRYQQSEHGKALMLARSREYRQTEQGRANARAAQTRSSKTERGRINGRIRSNRRRALLLKAPGTFSDADWQRTLTAHRNRCHYCKRAFTAKRPATIDHVIPISKGGAHSPENIVAACKPCNSAPTLAGWRPSCRCDAGPPVPQVVLDPFLGSGTTLLVADRLGRSGIGIELSPKYADVARQRLQRDAGPMFADTIEVSA